MIFTKSHSCYKTLDFINHYSHLLDTNNLKIRGEFKALIDLIDKGLELSNIIWKTGGKKGLAVSKFNMQFLLKRDMICIKKSYGMH